MKLVLLALISALVLPAMGAGGQAQACGQEEFLKKVCVSQQALPLTGEEITELVCEDRSLHSNIYASLGEAFKKSPAWFQARLCRLDGFGVYLPAKGTTISWSYVTDYGFGGGYIGISKLRMDQNYDLQTHAATMMRQAKKTKTIPEGTAFPEFFGYQPLVNNAAEGVLYLLAHEMGHLIYNHNSVERREYFHECEIIWDGLNCYPFKPDHYGFIDWIRGAGKLDSILRGEIRPEKAPLRDFITAGASVVYTPEIADRFFRDLHQSSFVSAFALYSPEEDYCETFTHVVMAESAGALKFQYLNGESINIWERVLRPQNPELKKKVQFVKDHLGK